MQIEVGKYYKTRDGCKVGPMERTPENYHFDKRYVWTSGWLGRNTPAENLFCENGCYWESGVKSDNDLISEWPAHTTTGTLAELGVNPGDVVEFVVERRNPYGYTYPTGETTVLDRGLVFGIRPEYDDAIWRIVSRASDLSKLDYTPINVENPIYEIGADTRTLEHFQSGPVITETVTYTKIVPGTFGPVKIVRGDFGCDVIVAPLNTDDTDQMIAARDVLSQLIDAMAPQA